MAGVVTASAECWIGLFSGLRPPVFSKPVRQMEREGADAPRLGRPWSPPLADRILLVAASRRTNLTMRQIAPLFGVSKSAADRIIDDLAPRLALRPSQRFAPDPVLIVDGTLVPTRDHSIAAPSKNYRYSTDHQVVIDPDSQMLVALGTPLPGNRNDCKASSESGAAHACRNHDVTGDGGYIATGVIIPHRRRPGETLPDWKAQHNTSHRHVRARVEHAFARMKTWKLLRDCRLRSEGVAAAMSGIARLHSLARAR